MRPPEDSACLFGKFPAALLRPGCLVTHPNRVRLESRQSRQAVSPGSIFLIFLVNTQRNQSAKKFAAIEF